MLKKRLRDALLVQLEETLKSLIISAEAAKDAATNTESKAESKWDTFGLESSYLAGAQAKRAETMRQTILLLQKFDFPEDEKLSHVQVRAIVRVDVDGEEKSFFILPFAGGNRLELGGQEYVVLTLDSPLGREMNERSVGDGFEFRQQGKLQEYEIVAIE